MATKMRKRPQLSKTSETGTVHIFKHKVGETYQSVCGKIFVKSVWPAKQSEIERQNVCKTCRMHYQPERDDAF